MRLAVAGQVAGRRLPGKWPAAGPRRPCVLYDAAVGAGPRKVFDCFSFRLLAYRHAPRSVANARRRAHAHTHASPPPQPTWTDGTTLIFDPEPGDVTGEVVFTVKVPRPTPNFHTHRTPGTRTPPCGEGRPGRPGDVAWSAPSGWPPPRIPPPPHTERCDGDVTGEVVWWPPPPQIPSYSPHTHAAPHTRDTHAALRLQRCVLAPKVFFGSKELNSRPARPGHTHTLQLQINLQI